MAGVMFQSAAKRPRLDNESDLDGFCDEDSYDSWTGYETAWVKDSGDDWSPSSSSESSQEGSDGEATDVIYELEYDVASDSNNERGNGSSSGDSDIEAMIIPIIAADFEDECWAESESSDEGVIIRRPSPPPKSSRTQHPADSLKCLRCNFPIIPPARYCHTCYQLRKETLPPRPTNRRRRRDESSGRAGPSSAATSQDVDGPSASSSGISSQETSSVRSTASSQEVDVSSSQEDATELCGSCGERKPDGAFIHGQTAHWVYCYSCSKKMRKNDNHCPICRRTIDKVVKMFRGNST